MKPQITNQPKLVIEGKFSVSSTNNDGSPYFNDFSEMVRWMMAKSSSIDTAVSNIRSLNDINRFFNIGRGGNHVWISDKANVRQAIIYY